MTPFDILLVIHLVAAMVWVGGALVGMLLGGQIARLGDATTMARFCTAFAQIAGPLFGGSSIVVMATGVWMVVDSPIEFSAAWVSIGFAGWLVSTIMGATVVGMSWTRLGRNLAEPGASLDALAPDLARARLLTWIDLFIRFAVIVVMVWRPA